MTTASPSLLRARGRLATTTPLLTDCGALCSCACCHSEEGEESGMLLFPGENTLYGPEDAAWMKLVPSGSYFQGSEVPLLVCNGTCPREKRPLACRVFPLGVRARRDGIAARMDARGAGLCPLVSSGVAGLSALFVEGVRAALDDLAEDARQRDYLHWLSRQIDACAKQLASLRGLFR